MLRISQLAVGVSSLVLASNTFGAIVPLNTFSTGTDYSANFAELQNVANIGYDSTAQAVRFAPSGNNGQSTIRYDTNPANTSAEPTDFLTETLSLDASFSNLGASGSIGFYTRINGNPTLTGDQKGVLALLNVASATSVQLRLFYNAVADSSVAGTAFYDATFNLASAAITQTTGTGGTGSTNGVAANSPLTLNLTQGAGSDPAFNLTVSDADGLIASTGTQLLTQTELYNGPGSVAIRANLGIAMSGAVQNSILIDNFSAVPEPAMLSVAALGGLALLGRRRAR